MGFDQSWLLKQSKFLGLKFVTFFHYFYIYYWSKALPTKNELTNNKQKQRVGGCLKNQ